MNDASRRPLGRRLLHGYLQLQRLNVAVSLALLAVALVAATALILHGV